MSAREQAFEIAGLIRVSVADLEVLAADIQDGTVDQLVDVVRFDVCRLLERLTFIGREEEATR